MNSKYINWLFAVLFGVLVVVWQILAKIYDNGSSYHNFENSMYVIVSLLFLLVFGVTVYIIYALVRKKPDQTLFVLSWIPTIAMFVSFILFFILGNGNINNWGMLESFGLFLAIVYSVILTIIIAIVFSTKRK